jgi:O-antigen ligase
MTAFLLALIFISPTIHYRVDLGAFSFAIMEPVVLFSSGVMLISLLTNRKKFSIPKNELVFLSFFIAIAALLFRPYSTNWTNGLSDVRDWGIPLLAVVIISSFVRKGWRKWILLLLFWVVLQSIFGIYQHVTDSMRPFANELTIYKTGFLISAEDETRLAEVSPATGFFSHPNGLAIFLYFGLMTAIGFFFNPGKRALKLLVILIIGVGLYFTYAKASLIMILATVSIFLLLRVFKRNRTLLPVSPVLIAAAVPVLWLAAQSVPALLLGTFQWRVNLWEVGLKILLENPQILLFGNGMDLFEQKAFYGQPHNVYVYLILQYGLFGLSWFISLFLLLFLQGWKARSKRLMDNEPLLAASWVALLGFFAIGFVESNLQGVEIRTMFFTYLICFTGLLKEVESERKTAAFRGAN